MQVGRGKQAKSLWHLLVKLCIHHQEGMDIGDHLEQCTCFIQGFMQASEMDVVWSGQSGPQASWEVVPTSFQYLFPLSRRCPGP